MDLVMLRPEIEEYQSGNYEGLLDYIKDLDRYMDHLEDNCTYLKGEYRKV